ncbi:MAG: DNA-binding response regulator [Ignavibacteria bacterium RBG_16_34_14]|nr:MAG: DNA-binding response regulator [Ignavibacteria bacterium RBG_16_34_14]
MNINVAIVEDNDKIRDGLSLLIDGSDGFHCVATYSNAEDALKYLPNKKPDVVLMDIQLPKMSGIECVENLKEKSPDLQIMMLTVYEDNEQVFKSLAAGATGYILKRTPPAELLEAIRELHEGGSPMSDQIARKVVQTFQQIGKSSKETENLSERETEILSYLAKGYQDKEIAEKFFLSVKTIRTHLRNIYKKLHVHSRTEAVLKYLRK